MAIQPCPNCKSPTIRWLEGLSNDAWVDYYRCGVCGEVWTVPKPGVSPPDDVPSTDLDKPQ